MRNGTRLAVLVLLVLAGSARADDEESERRLKTAGIEPELRERIHDATDRGVAYLRRQQAADGRWTSVISEPGVTALCTLALRHAGTDEARIGFERGIAHLLPDRGAGIAGIHEFVYTAGIAAMILMADRSRVGVGREIARDIARSIEPRSGWWGYWLVCTEGKTRRPEATWMGRDLSTTQFAGLGLWAGDRLGARIGKRVWRTHLEALIRFRTKEGSWPMTRGPRRRTNSRTDRARWSTGRVESPSPTSRRWAACPGAGSARRGSADGSERTGAGATTRRTGTWGALPPDPTRHGLRAPLPPPRVRTGPRGRSRRFVPFAASSRSPAARGSTRPSLSREDSSRPSEAANPRLDM